MKIEKLATKKKKELIFPHVFLIFLHDSLPHEHKVSHLHVRGNHVKISKTRGNSDSLKNTSNKNK